jgi:hypothetical protein
VLRNSSDQTIEKTPGRFVTELYGGTGRPQRVKSEEEMIAPRPRPRPVVAAVVAPPPPPPPAPPPPPPPDQVVVIRGNTRTVETLPSRINN